MQTCPFCLNTSVDDAQFCNSCGQPFKQPELDPTPKLVQPANTSIACPSCGKVLAQDTRFCGNCGAAQNVTLPPAKIAPVPERACAICGASLSPNAIFCGNCGKPVAQSSPAPPMSVQPTATQQTFGASSTNSAQLPNSGKTVLTFGILSLFGCGLIFGIPAWIMGRRSLKIIEGNGGIHPDRGLYQAGTIIGMLSTLLSLAAFGIGAIMALSGPAGGGTNNARRNVLLANGKIIGTSFVMYTADHDDVLPPYGADIQVLLKPYAKHEDVLRPFIYSYVGLLSTSAIEVPAETELGYLSGSEVGVEDQRVAVYADSKAAWIEGTVPVQDNFFETNVRQRWQYKTSDEDKNDLTFQWEFAPDNSYESVFLGKPGSKEMPSMLILGQGKYSLSGTQIKLRAANSIRVYYRKTNERNWTFVPTDTKTEFKDLYAMAKKDLFPSRDCTVVGLSPIELHAEFDGEALIFKSISPDQRIEPNKGTP